MLPEICPKRLLKDRGLYRKHKLLKVDPFFSGTFISLIVIYSCGRKDKVKVA